MPQSPVTPEPIVRLSCCVCGASTKGRQWWNRDTGYGLCEKCADDPRVTSQGAETMRSYYGVRGVHYCVDDSDCTLNERLEAAGLTTEPAGNYRKRVLRDGVCVFEGTAHDVTAWLDKGGADAKPVRCEVLWHYFDKAEKKHVERWLPGVLLETFANGRHHVRCDNGFTTEDAAPECVRVVGVTEGQPS